MLEVEIFQRGTTTLTMETILLHRGTASAGGTGVTEYEFQTTSPSPTTLGFSLPTTDVGSATETWQLRRGFNLLQEAVHLPIPDLWVPVAASVDFGIAQMTGTAHTGVGVSITWAEFTGT